MLMSNSGSCMDCTVSWNGCANGALNCTQTGVVPMFSGISEVFWTESTNSGRGGGRGGGGEGGRGGGEEEEEGGGGRSEGGRSEGGRREGGREQESRRSRRRRRGRRKEEHNYSCSGLEHLNNTLTPLSYWIKVHSQIQQINIYCMHTGNDITSMSLHNSESQLNTGSYHIPLLKSKSLRRLHCCAGTRSRHDPPRGCLRLSLRNGRCSFIAPWIHSQVTAIPP